MNRKKELLEAFFLIILFLFIIAQLVLPETGIGGVLTRREQEIPLFYKWWDELRLTRRFLDFWDLLYYNAFINQSYLTERV